MVIMARDATLKVPAIHCRGCVRTVTRNLEALPTLQVTQADPESKLVRLQFEEPAVTLDRIRETLDEIGYSPDD
jgi:copper chaperone CopZ